MAKAARKTPQEKTNEELYSLSQEALKDPELVKIIKNAPVKKDGHINFTAVYNAAFDYVYGQTKDLKKSKELAVATRWGAKFKEKDAVEFDTEIIEADIKTHLAKLGGKPESKPEPKDVEIDLAGDIIFPFNGEKFLRIAARDLPFAGISMAAELLRAITGVQPLRAKDRQYCSTGIELKYYPGAIGGKNLLERFAALRDYLIQILEEKFGLTIKTCFSCVYSRSCPVPTCSNPIFCGDKFKFKMWEPREIPEERKE